MTKQKDPRDPTINLIDPYVIYHKVLSWCGDSQQYSLVG